MRVNKAGCFSQCGHGPMVVVYPENVWYAGVQASDLEEILDSHIVAGRPVERLRYEPGKPGANKSEVEGRASRPPPRPDGGAGGLEARVRGRRRAGQRHEGVPGGRRQRVLVVHTGDGVRRLPGAVPARGHPAGGRVSTTGRTLTCLEHMWQFDLRTGAPMGDATEGLKGYPIREDKGELYVSLEG